MFQFIQFFTMGIKITNFFFFLLKKEAHRDLFYENIQKLTLIVLIESDACFATRTTYASWFTLPLHSFLHPYYTSWRENAQPHWRRVLCSPNCFVAVPTSLRSKFALITKTWLDKSALSKTWVLREALPEYSLIITRDIFNVKTLEKLMKKITFLIIW